MAIVIGFGHKFGSGKDTAADHLVREHGFVKLSFGYFVKKTVQQAFGFTDEQTFTRKRHEVDSYWDVTPARVFQVVGTQCMRETLPQHLPLIGPDLWMRRVEKEILSITEEDPDARITIPDVRFPNEAFLIQRYGVLARCECPLKERQRRTGDYDRDPQHKSETALDIYTGWDWIIENGEGVTEDVFLEGVETVYQNAIRNAIRALQEAD